MALYGEYYTFEDDRIKIIKGEKIPSGCVGVLTRNLVSNIFKELETVSDLDGIPDSPLAKQMLNKSYFIEIGGDVRSIGEEAFRNNKSIDRVRIADLNNNIDFFIGDSAFEGCSLRTIETDDSSRFSICTDAFSFCKNLTTVTFLSCTSIFSSAFDFCERLKTITIPKDIKFISSTCFSKCKSLESIYIPKIFLENFNDATTVIDFSNAKIILYDDFNEYDVTGQVLGKRTNISRQQIIEEPKTTSIITPQTSKPTIKNYNGVIRTNIIANKKKNKR